MPPWVQTIVTVVCAMLGSSGMWAYLQKKSEKKQIEAEKKDVRTKMLIGLAHDRIIYLGMKYIERGWVSQSEYENLYKYLYEPYKEMGGNGSAERIMQEIKKLELRPDNYGV